MVETRSSKKATEPKKEAEDIVDVEMKDAVLEKTPEEIAAEAKVQLLNGTYI